MKRVLNADVLPEWSDRDARTITSREVIELLDKIVDRGSPVMANRTANILSQMFIYGIYRATVADSPVKLMYRPGGSETPAERALSGTELKVFLLNCGLPYSAKRAYSRDTPFHHAAASGACTREEDGIRSRESHLVDP